MPATTSTTIIPYLFFAGRCEEALNFYTGALGGTIVAMVRFHESPETPPPGMLEPGFEKKIMHSELSVAGATVYASDGCGSQDGTSHDGYRLALTLHTEASARKAFDALAVGGSVEMPLSPTAWSKLFGMLTDKFNVKWMVQVAGAGAGAKEA